MNQPHAASRNLLSSAAERLHAHRVRTLLSAAGIAISVAALVFLLTLTWNVYLFVAAGLESFGSRMLFVHPAPDAKQLAKPPRRPAGLAAAMRRANGIDGVAPLIQIQGALRACGKQIVVRVVGATPAHKRLEMTTLESGRYIADVDLLQATRVVVLDTGVRDELECARTGAWVVVSGRPFRVIGVTKTVGAKFGGNEFVHSVYIPIVTAERMYGTVLARGLSFIASVRHDADVPQTKRELERVLSAAQLSWYRVATQQELLVALRNGVGSARLIIGAVAAVGLLVAGIGVMNSMYASVVERTFEIGLRRAVGATRNNIRKQFLLEALWTAGVGGVVGVLAGTAGAILFCRWLELPSTLDPRAVIGSVLATGILSLVASAWPAETAASLDPADAINYGG